MCPSEGSPTKSRNDCWDRNDTFCNYNLGRNDLLQMFGVFEARIYSHPKRPFAARFARLEPDWKKNSGSPFYPETRDRLNL